MSRAALALLLAGACVNAGSGPEAIVFDRDVCAECSMAISDRAFAAEIRAPKGGVRKFDDVGCALRWLEKQRWGKEHAAPFWVARHRDGAWLDARAAHYVGGKTSPMGHGFAALDPAEPGLDFEGLRRAVVPASPPPAHGRTP